MTMCQMYVCMYLYRLKEKYAECNSVHYVLYAYQEVCHHTNIQLALLCLASTIASTYLPSQ